MSGPDDAREGPEACLLAFSLGPVQTFIASARSVRDLWTGSYLLSWLTCRAMRPVLDRHGPGAFVMPALAGQPAPGSRRSGRSGPASPGEPAEPLPRRRARRSRRRRCPGAGRRVRGAMPRRLEGGLRGRPGRPRQNGPATSIPDWDRLWDAQVADFFEIRTAVLPFAACGEETLERLLGPSFDASRPHTLWWGRLQLVARLMAAQRAAGHQPAYRPGATSPRNARCWAPTSRWGRPRSTSRGNSGRPWPMSRLGRDPDSPERAALRDQPGQAVRLAGVPEPRARPRPQGRLLSRHGDRGRRRVAPSRARTRSTRCKNALGRRVTGPASGSTGRRREALQNGTRGPRS